MLPEPYNNNYYIVQTPDYVTIMGELNHEVLNTKNRSHSIKVEVDNSGGRSEGVLVAARGMSAGYSLYVKGGKVVYEYNYFDKVRLTVVSSAQSAPISCCVHPRRASAPWTGRNKAEPDDQFSSIASQVNSSGQ